VKLLWNMPASEAGGNVPAKRNACRYFPQDGTVKTKMERME
jgi:hypothetical protein